jgi:hypothetical protein
MNKYGNGFFFTTCRDSFHTIIWEFTNIWISLSKWLIQMAQDRLGVVAWACNPSHLGGGDWFEAN